MSNLGLLVIRVDAYGWSIARDLADPELWTERYHCPTWQDFLRQRNRSTNSERALHQRAKEFHIGPAPIRGPPDVGAADRIRPVEERHARPIDDGPRPIAGPGVAGV